MGPHTTLDPHSPSETFVLNKDDVSSHEEGTESVASSDQKEDSSISSSGEDTTEPFLAGHGNARGLTAPSSTMTLDLWEQSRQPS